MGEAIANLINRCSPEAFFGIVITIGGAFLVAIIGIITTSWSQWRKRELDTSLKQEMLARGMSVEEIERVLSAGSGTLSGTSQVVERSPSRTRSKRPQ